MKTEKGTKALIELSDVMICASNDFHCLHFNVTGTDFDTLHRKILKKYYEQAADDYDELAEKARCYGATIPNASQAAERIGYNVPESNITDRDTTVSETQKVLDLILEQMLIVYRYFNRIEDCPVAVGIANYLQTRLEYWSKEATYFNKSRGKNERV